MVHSEVSEALEDYRAGHAVNKVWYEYKDGFKRDTPSAEFYIDDNWTPVLGKPCGIPSELADVVIRILDICGLYEWDIESSHNKKIPLKQRRFASHLASIHKSLSNSYDDEQDTFTDPDVDYLDCAIQEIEYICETNNINLEQTIQEKLAYNRTRGYKHGGKVI